MAVEVRAGGRAPWVWGGFALPSFFPTSAHTKEAGNCLVTEKKERTALLNSRLRNPVCRNIPQENRSLIKPEKNVK